MCSPGMDQLGKFMASPILATQGKENPLGLKFTPANQPQASSQINDPSSSQPQRIQQQNQVTSIASAPKVAPKFNFRSSPFSIQQEQAGGESGLNVG
jgi:hypothetical protein